MDDFFNGWNIVTTITNEGAEHAYRYEKDAQADWGMAVNNGKMVSLIAFDPERKAYVFNTYE